MKTGILSFCFYHFLFTLHYYLGPEVSFYYHFETISGFYDLKLNSEEEPTAQNESILKINGRNLLPCSAGPLSGSRVHVQQSVRVRLLFHIGSSMETPLVPW